MATGAFINAIGILAGGLFGLVWRKPISMRTQIFLRNVLGVAAIFFGMRLFWMGIQQPHFPATLKQFIAAMLALILGNLIGHVLCLQKISNRAGRYAGNLIAAAQKKSGQKSTDGFNACAILFCAAPMGIIGAISDGLSGYFWLLAIKAVMDALAMMSFAKIFRWLVLLSAVPVFLLLTIITLATRFYVEPFLAADDLANSINAVNGLIACAVALVIFEVRKVELSNFLPSLFLAPVFASFFK